MWYTYRVHACTYHTCNDCDYFCIKQRCMIVNFSAYTCTYILTFISEFYRTVKQRVERYMKEHNLVCKSSIFIIMLQIGGFTPLKYYSGSMATYVRKLKSAKSDYPARMRKGSCNRFCLSSSVCLSVCRR